MDKPEYSNGTRSLIHFRDILEERRKGSDIMWMTKPWAPLYACVQPHPCDPISIRKAVFHSERVRRVVSELCIEKGVKESDLLGEVQLHLTEIGHNKKMPVIRWIGLFVTKVLKKTCSGLMINEASVERVSTPLYIILFPLVKLFSNVRCTCFSSKQL